MIEIFKRNKEVILYIVFGLLTTIVNIIVFALCRDLFRMNLVSANILAWFWSVLFAYFTNKKWVFDTGETYTLKEIFSFYTARIVTLLVETFMLYLLINIFMTNDMISKVICNIVVIVLNYVFSKLFVFKIT